MKVGDLYVYTEGQVSFIAFMVMTAVLLTAMYLVGQGTNRR